MMQNMLHFCTFLIHKKCIKFVSFARRAAPASAIENGAGNSKPALLLQLSHLLAAELSGASAAAHFIWLHEQRDATVVFGQAVDGRHSGVGCSIVGLQAPAKFLSLNHFACLQYAVFWSSSLCASSRQLPGGA